MIEAFSARISAYVYRHNDRQHVSQEVMKFALIALLTHTLTIVLSLIIGIMIGKFQETCIVVLAMTSLRYLAGGHHLSSPVLCIIFSSAAVVVVPFIPISTPILYTFTAISALLVWKYAPVDMRGKTRISDRTLNIMKYTGLVLVLSNILIQSEILAVSWFIISLTLLPYKGVESHE